jgi:hypothetical protein
MGLAACFSACSIGVGIALAEAKGKVKKAEGNKERQK